MKKLKKMALFGSMLAVVALVAMMFFATTVEVNAQATTTAAATTAAATTANSTTIAATTSAATTSAMTTSAATTSAATTSAATTSAATTAATTTTAAATTTAATTTAATTTAATTTAATTTAAATKGANTGLPYYSPNKPAVLTAAALDTFDKAFKGAGGAATAGAKYDFFFTPDGEAKLVTYYDAAMKTLGYTQVGKNSTSADGFSGTAYAYSNGTDGKIVTVLGPLTAAQAQSFTTQLSSGSAAAGDSLVILISGIATGSAQGGAGPATTTAATTSPSAPATGFGGANSDNGFNALWLLLPLALVSAMSGAALIARRKTNR